MSARLSVLILGCAALACGSEPPSQPSVQAGAPPEIENVAAGSERTEAAPGAGGAATPDTPQPPARPASVLAPPAPAHELAAVPLDRLLALPPAPSEGPDLAEILRREAAAASAAENASSPSRLRFDLDQRTDAPIERSDLKREQVDAAVAVDVGRDTSLRGSVRVERETEAAESSVGTTPSIGIEKRF